MRFSKVFVCGAVFSVIASLVLLAPGQTQNSAALTVDTQAVTRAQDQAADEVMAQLEGADRPLAMSEIEALDRLGPSPWLSFTSTRSRKSMAAWRAVADQLPANDLAPTGLSITSAITFTESEAPDETGGNDTAETGDLIPGFGTGTDDAPVVTITGALSGVDARPPIEGDCESTEDDGSIDSANATPPELQVALCIGEIGDGPFGETSGDFDFYAFGEVEEGANLIVDVEHVSGSLDPVTAITGIYDADGNLLDSIEDSGAPGEGIFLSVIAPAAGEYFAVVGGCCDLQSDPTDSASGPGVGSTGTYEVFVVTLPPPCASDEDDGSIALANQTLVGEQAFDFCIGEIGDGPHGAADGDFYSVGTVDPSTTLFVDVIAFGEGPSTVIGIYDAAGNLLASGEDTGDPETTEPILFAPEDPLELFVAVVGCCDLPSDPTDPSSGSPSDQTGLYEVQFQIIPDPCLSTEDDGSIDLANNAAGAGQTGDVFVNLCAGEIGDGPQAELNGDVDFFRTRELPVGQLLIVDFADAGDAAGAGDLTIGIYNATGDLIGSGQDDPGQAGPNSDPFFVEIPEAGEYYIAIAGGLPTDPFDPTTATDNEIVSSYADVFVVDGPPGILGSAASDWAGVSGEDPDDRIGPLSSAMAALAAKKAAAAASVATTEEPVIDTDFFLVDLEKGDAISGGFDRALEVGIFDLEGVLRSSSQFNPSFIYPASSPLRHTRRNGFDHVVTESGRYAVYVTQGFAGYEGELRVVKSGRAPEAGDDQQIIFLDFDGAPVAADVFGVESDAELSPLSAFLGNWGLDASDEDAVIDSTIDAVLETLDADLRVLDGRNGDRDASGTPTEFDLEILNSRDHGERWGDPNVTRLIVGGTIPELQIPTIGLAQTIDPGNTDSEETAVVLLDIMSGPPGDSASINTYELAPGVAKADFVGFVVGHIVGHEVGHVIGNWHQETFNEIESIMDAGGDFPAIAGVGDDGIFGTADDTDPDFVEDIFSTGEGFVGIEDTSGRSTFAMSTGQGEPTGGGDFGDLMIELDGVAFPGEPVDVYAEFTGGTAPYSVTIDWGDGASCPGDGACLVDPMEDAMPGLVDADYTYSEAGVFTVTVTVTDATGATAVASADTAACTIIGTNRAETINGTDEADVICGLGGNDRIFGLAGNDLIFGGTGRDRIDGGEGQDTVLGGREPDTISGGDDADTLSGGKGNDIMRGGDGVDIMSGRLGGDRMFGEAGNDLMIGNRGDDRMYGGIGDDIMSGRRGTDIIRGQIGNDTLNGGQGRDNLSGSSGDDDLSGGSGADSLLGGQGDDDLDGGDDIDRCIGGPGTNTLTACER